MHATSVSVLLTIRTSLTPVSPSSVDSSRKVSSRHGVPTTVVHAPTIFNDPFLQLASDRISIDGKTVEQTGAARAHQILLAASSARVDRIPRNVAAAGSIVVADLRASRPRAGPVLAGVIVGAWKCGAVGPRARQNVVAVRRVADAIDGLAFFRQRRLLRQIVADARRVER